MRLEENVLSVLSSASVEGNSIKLNCGQLERNIYLSVNKVLEYIGGKWNRKTGSHIFSTSPEDRLEQIILTGEVDPPDRLGYFPTPKPVVHRMLELAEIETGMSVLEPSAGQGHISDELLKLGCDLTVVELLPMNRTILEKKGYTLSGDDFLKFDGKFDRIIMNPPFEKQADIDHVTHAYSLLKPNGKLVSVMSSGIAFRSNRKTTLFRDLVDGCGMFERLPEGSFKESGTMVNTVLVVLEN